MNRRRLRRGIVVLGTVLAVTVALAGAISPCSGGWRRGRLAVAVCGVSESGSARFAPATLLIALGVWALDVPRGRRRHELAVMLGLLIVALPLVTQPRSDEPRSLQ